MAPDTPCRAAPACYGRRPLARLALALALISLPAVALAQDASAEPAAEEPAAAWGAIVLSFGGDGSEPMNAEARDGVTAALVAQGFSVLDEAEIAARIPPARLTGAASVDALRAVASELGAESVATVAVWTSDAVADSVIVSVAPAAGGRSFSATEHVREAGLLAAARAATLGALERRTRAAVLDGGSGSAASGTEAAVELTPEPAPEDDPWAENARPSGGEPEAIFGIVGPGLLLALGAAGLGLGIYAVLDENCELRAAISRDCLRGDAPNTALGVLLIIGGALSAAGAAVWWITGATTTNEPRVDGVVREDGGMLRARGVF
jgi:hypothetical protein